MPDQTDILSTLPGDTVQMVHPNGDLYDIPKASIQEAGASGFTLPSPEQIEEFHNASKYGAGHGLKAFGLGALKSVPGALLGAVKTGLIDPETARQLEKYHPVADAAGELSGTAAGLLGGLSGAVAGGKLASEGAAAALARLGLGEAAESAGARIAGKTAAKVLGSAVEGATYAGQNVINEYAIGDPRLNADSIVSQVGLGALLGGGLEGAMGLGSYALPKAAQAAKSALQSTADVFGGGKLADIAKEGYASASSVVSGVPKEDILSALNSGRVKTGEVTSSLNSLYKHSVKSTEDALDDLGIYGTTYEDFKVAKNQFEPRFMYKSKDGYKIDPSKVESFLKAPNTSASQLKADVLSDFTSKAKALNDHLADVYAAVPDKGFDNEAFNTILSQNDKLLQERALGDATSKLGAYSQGGDLLEAGLMGAGARALGVPHPMIGAGLAAYSALKSPLKTIQRLHRMQELANDTLSAITKGTDALAKSSLGSLSTLKSYGAGKLAIPDRDTYDKRVAELQALAGTPTQLISKVDDSTANLRPHAPQISSNLAQTASRAVQFLNSKIPQPPQDPSQILAPKQEPSMSDISKFSRYYVAAHNPLSILKDAVRGTLTKEAVEAVSAIYPALMGTIQKHALSSIVEKKGDHISYRNKQMLSMLGGKDLDGSMNPHMVLSNQAVLMGAGMNKQLPQAGHGSAGKTRVSGLKDLSFGNRLSTAMQLSARRQ